jgi:hypothetical protein
LRATARIVLHVTWQVEPPAGAGAVPALRRAAAPFRGIPAREIWGYAVWFFVAVVFAIPEAWSGFGNTPWPTLSITVAHLEALWPGTRVVIVGLIVLLVFQAFKYPLRHTGNFAAAAGEPVRGRTPNGRLTKNPDGISVVFGVGYLLVALVAVAGGSLITASLTSDMYILGYVIYGLFAIFLVLVPNALAFWFARDVVFPTFFRTIADLESRWRFAAVLAVFALVILAFHLVFFPWPNVPA